MEALWNWIRIHVVSWITPPKTIEIIDIVQVIVIAYFVYHLILWVKNTRAYTLLKGILFIVAFVVIVNVLQMDVIVWLLGNLSVAAITAIVIIFQPELRKVLEQMGHKNPLASLFSLGRLSGEANQRFTDQTINELVRASFEMAEVKTGALIVVEREVRLEEYEKTGIPVDAVLTAQLLINIFEHNTPLHDGAIIVRNDRIVAATCYLPLSDNMELSKDLGTRHRAAVGMSEVSDAMIVVVSEETGGVSVAQGGRLSRNLTEAELRERFHAIQQRKHSKNPANILVEKLKKGRHDDDKKAEK